MSTHVMGKCWPLQMPPTPKAVLMSLADNANDAGECFPSISTISMRTCFGRTAVIEAIQWLEQNGHVVADRSNGRHTTYTILAGRSDDLFAGRTGPGRKPVRQPHRLRVVGGSNSRGKGAALVSDALADDADAGLFVHHDSENQSSSRTSSEHELVCETDSTSPPAGPDQSACRTEPVREADTNRQEPSVTIIEPSSAQARDDDEEQLSIAEIDRVLCMFPVEQIPASLSRNTLARFIRHRKVIRRPVSTSAWFELRSRFAQLLAQGHDLNRSLRETIAAGLAIPVTPKIPGEHANGNRSQSSAGLGQRVAANAERAVRAAADAGFHDAVVHGEARNAVGSPD